MKTRTLVILSSAIEAATALALIAVPDLVAHLLLGTELTGTGRAVALVAGFALLALALACWPGSDDATPPTARALFVYNLLTGFYLGYLRVGGGFAGFLLWPACVLHVVLAFLLALPAYQTGSFATAR